MNHSFIIVYNYEIKIIFVLYISLLYVQNINRVFSLTVTFAQQFSYSFIYLKYAVIMIVIELDSHTDSCFSCCVLCSSLFASHFCILAKV
jgi:hypothetical protein